jgi:predicted secreted protein
MGIGAAFVMFAVVWFMLLLVILPLRIKSQSEAGNVVKGTPSSAPDDPMLGKKFMWVTILTLPTWAIICGIIISGVITVDMFDIYNGIKN